MIPAAVCYVLAAGLVAYVIRCDLQDRRRRAEEVLRQLLQDD